MQSLNAAYISAIGNLSDDLAAKKTGARTDTEDTNWSWIAACFCCCKFQGIWNINVLLFFYRIPLLWSPKDHMQDTGDSRRFICQQYDIVNCMFGSGVMFSWISGLPCSSSPELELKSTILALFTPLTGSKLKTAIDYFPHINFAHWRNSTDVSFNDVLLFSKMPPYFELKLELYSFLLSDQSMVWMFQKTWAKLSEVLGWRHSTTCTRSKVIV